MTPRLKLVSMRMPHGLAAASIHTGLSWNWTAIGTVLLALATVLLAVYTIFKHPARPAGCRGSG